MHQPEQFVDAIYKSGVVAVAASSNFSDWVGGSRVGGARLPDRFHFHILPVLQPSDTSCRQDWPFISSRSSCWWSRQTESPESPFRHLVHEQPPFQHADYRLINKYWVTDATVQDTHTHTLVLHVSLFLSSSCIYYFAMFSQCTAQLIKSSPALFTRNH